MNTVTNTVNLTNVREGVEFSDKYGNDSLANIVIFN